MHAACITVRRSCVTGHRQMSSRLLVLKNGAFIAQHLSRGSLLSWGLKVSRTVTTKNVDLIMQLRCDYAVSQQACHDIACLPSLHAWFHI